jgi:hypothetical protein
MRRLAVILLGVVLATSACAQYHHFVGNKLEVQEAWGTYEIYAIAPDVVRINTHPTGVKPIPTTMMNRHGMRNAKPIAATYLDGSFTVGDLRVTVDKWLFYIKNKATGVNIIIDHRDLCAGVLSLRNLEAGDLSDLRSNRALGSTDPNLVGGYGVENSKEPPVAYCPHWGVWVDSVDGTFTKIPEGLMFSHGSRKDLEAYIILGEPKRTLQVVEALTTPRRRGTL